LEFLDFVVDSTKQAFLLPKQKIDSWSVLREQILARKKEVHIKTLQRFQGKCISFSLAVPGAKSFIRAMSSAIASAPANGHVTLSRDLREEILHWRFLDSWPGSLRWRDEKHLHLSLSTDASGYGWGCGVHSSVGDYSLGDYWTEEQLALNI